LISSLANGASVYGMVVCMLLITQHDPVIQQRLARELGDVTDRFASELESDIDCVNGLVRHIEQYRGKMLRPTLVLATAMALRPQLDRPLPAHRVVATVVEMVHMATLVHDDILDEADLRRRGATVNHLHGNEGAVMLGDYLISHAYHLCSSLVDTSISRTIAMATNIICEGELLQLGNRNNWHLDEATYFDIIRRKTASLCGTCCSLAAKVFEAGDLAADAMDNYGRKLGMAFQIVDDVLDLAGDEQTVGKTLGRDLDKGKLTLPVIRAIASADTSKQVQLLNALEHRQLDIVREQVLGSGAVESARQTAADLAESAKTSLLEVLDDSSARTLMLDMADAVLTRES